MAKRKKRGAPGSRRIRPVAERTAFWPEGPGNGARSRRGAACQWHASSADRAEGETLYAVAEGAERDNEEARSGRLRGEMARGTAKEAAGGTVKEELVERLRELAQWKNNDVVKLAFLEAGDTGQVEKLDLTGVVELKRNPNGTFEAKFVDKVRVLAMLRELLEQREDGRLEEFMDALRPGDGDET